MAAQGAGLASPFVGNVLKASSRGGEVVLGSTGGGTIAAVLGGIPGAGSVLTAINPFKVLATGAANLFKSLGAAFKSKKFGAIITALILAALWLVLTLLPTLGINPLPVQALSWLTFAQGGLTGGIGGGIGGFGSILGRGVSYATGLLGGMLGKGLVAGLVVGMVAALMQGQNPFKSIGGGFTSMFSAFKLKSPSSIGSLLLGVGIALIGYNFMAGTASLSATMAAVAAFLMTLKSLDSRAGFLKSLLGGILAKNKQVDTTAVNTCMAGMASGFALAVPLSAIPWAYTPYVAGAVLLVAGIILALALRGNREVVAA